MNWMEMDIGKYNNNENQPILEIISNKDIQSKVPKKKRGRPKKEVYKQEAYEQPEEQKQLPKDNQKKKAKKLQQEQDKVDHGWKHIDESTEISATEILVIQSRTLFESKTKFHEIVEYFLNEQFWNNIVDQTNINAKNFIDSEEGKEYLAKFPFSLYHRWIDTTLAEIKRFIGVQMLMGFIRVPDQYGNLIIILNLKLYLDHWGTESLFKTSVSDVMAINRYKLLNEYFQISPR